MQLEAPISGPHTRDSEIFDYIIDAATNNVKQIARDGRGCVKSEAHRGHLALSLPSQSTGVLRSCNIKYDSSKRKKNN